MCIIKNFVRKENKTYLLPICDRVLQMQKPTHVNLQNMFSILINGFLLFTGVVEMYTMKEHQKIMFKEFFFLYLSDFFKMLLVQYNIVEILFLKMFHCHSIIQ